jgi:hypothetical protein
MSFLRHKEIYPCDEGRDLATAPPLIAVDEPPAGYSWQVALQQSPLPLHQPELYCQSSTAPDNASAANGEMSLNWLSQPRGPLHFCNLTSNL